jgi:hypothetical protein
VKTTCGLPEARRNALLAPLDVSDEETVTAALTLASGAADASELRCWLEMCGMQPYSSRGPLTSSGRPARTDLTGKRGAAS